MPFEAPQPLIDKYITKLNAGSYEQFDDLPASQRSEAATYAAMTEAVDTSLGASASELTPGWIRGRPAAGGVGQSQLDAVLLNWGHAVNGAAGGVALTTVPEPTASASLILGLLLTGRRWR